MTEVEKKAIQKIQSVTGLAGGAYAVIRDGSIRKECFGYADLETH